MQLSFYKYHGTGNDFILVDNRDGLFCPDDKLIAWLCHRRFGIGADGLILLNNATGFDFGMQYFNSDGRESTMCGNGGRCIVAFADFLSLSGQKCRFLAADGEHTGTILKKDGTNYMVRLSMNDVQGYQIIKGDYLINTGSPQLVRFVEDLPNRDLFNEGRFIRNLDRFQPDGINVNFVQADGDKIFARTYERGVEEETLSCGTGVTASALAFAVIKNSNEGIIGVQTKGGMLQVHFSRQGDGFNQIYLEGPVIQVFSGSIELNDIRNLPGDQLI